MTGRLADRLPHSPATWAALAAIIVGTAVTAVSIAMGPRQPTAGTTLAPFWDTLVYVVLNAAYLGLAALLIARRQLKRRI